MVEDLLQKKNTKKNEFVRFPAPKPTKRLEFLINRIFLKVLAYVSWSAPSSIIYSRQIMSLTSIALFPVDDIKYN
jgi:hypothetical protein